ncbi:MAG: CinA family protein [bacterium]
MRVKMMKSEVRELHQLLRDEGSRLVVAESCTGGMLGEIITRIPGSSDVFSGGVISYSNHVKHSVLEVSEETLEHHGAVSKATAQEMVTGVCELLNVIAGISITGIAGPGGGTDDKPVGLVFIGCKYGDEMKIVREEFQGQRNDIRTYSVYSSIQELVKMMKS